MKSQKRKLLVIGVDPGTGVNSPMGLSAFEPATKKVIALDEYWTDYKKLEHRIRDISAKLEARLSSFSASYDEVHIYIESFVMRGKGGETLQRMIGSVMGRTPFEFKLDHVQNTSVKLIVGGKGTADKVDVAQGLLDFFGRTPELNALVDKESWDALDALAIGLAGWHRSKVRNESTKQQAKKKVR